MKIRLTKDLPGATSGYVFEVQQGRVCVPSYLVGGNPVPPKVYMLSELEGWYKEVKEESPRWSIGNGEVYELSKDAELGEKEQAMMATWPIFRTKESAENYRDALKETYGKEIKYSCRPEKILARTYEEAKSFPPKYQILIELTGSDAENIKNLVDALNDRVQ